MEGIIEEICPLWNFIHHSRHLKNVS